MTHLKNKLIGPQAASCHKIDVLAISEMGTLTFHIISTDRVIIRRWQKAFQKEGWDVISEESCIPVGEAGPGGAELDLVEIGIPSCRTPDDLRSMLDVRHPVSVLTFGDSQEISNTQITSFLEAGSDDFVYKNLDERVLVAKLKAHMRRLMPIITEAAAKCISSNGEIEIDNCSRAVRIEAKSGKYTELSNLTQKEFDILSILVRNEKRVVTREAMLEKLWGAEACSVYPECVDKHIESLRKKLGLCGKRIKTVYGSGYMFTGNNKS